MPVSRCICKNITFSQIKLLADQGCTLQQIVDETGCTSGCGMCGPYVRLAFKTGRTSLPILSEAQVRKIMAEMPLKTPIG